MAKIAYIRVSTEHQNTDLQREAMPSDIEKVFEEKVSGKSKERPQLKACLTYLREGDELYVYSISRFARNTRDLLEMVEDLTARGVEFISLKEKVDTRTPQGKFILTVWGAMAEMEREQILERQADGIAVAKANGAYTGRQPIKVDEKEFKRVVSIWKKGEITAREAMNRLNLKPNTFYRRVKELEQSSNN
jgi:DNA invertase Pin-like site-specific DNA recombinase